MSKDIKILETLIKENIKGAVTKKDLKTWFLEIQNKQQHGFCVSLSSEQLYKLTESLGIKVVNKTQELKGLCSIQTIEEIKRIPTKRKFKFTEEEFRELYLVKQLRQKDIAAKLKVANHTVAQAILAFGLPERAIGRVQADKVVLTKNLLQELYINQKLTKDKIAQITGKKLCTVNNYLSKYKMLGSV